MFFEGGGYKFYNNFIHSVPNQIILDQAFKDQFDVRDCHSFSHIDQLIHFPYIFIFHIFSCIHSSYKINFIAKH